MTRLYCHVDDKLLLKANVYAADGVTAATPTSGTIVIYNDDDETVLVAAGTACAVGSGYCQYNLTDTDEAGRYVAYMTVVISASATQTETFIFTILEKAA